jgi:hypothetical protein
LRLAVAVEDFEKRPDRELSEDGVAEMAAGVDLVVVTPSHLRAGDVSVGDQVGEDPLRGPFCDSDLIGDVACTGSRIARDAEQHVRVVSQEDPGAGRPRFALRLLHLDRVADFLSGDCSIANYETRNFCRVS